MPLASPAWVAPMADPLHYQVAIAGAGIAGTALACALAGNGLRVALIEARYIAC